LGACLLPALDNLHQTNDLFIGYVTMALQTHILTNYIGTSAAAQTASKRPDGAPASDRQAGHF